MRIVPVIVAAVLLGTPAPADACGGFFCSGGPGSPPPVIQTGEKILFAYEGDKVTAHVQILYQGDPRAFAWVVPTPSVPTLSVGSDQVFTLLDAATQPTFAINWTETCRPPTSFGCALGRSFSPSATAGSGTEEDGRVKVISRQPVGPFDTAVLSATDPNALAAWLAANDFDLAPETEPLIAHYVDKGDYFVALKLQSDRTVGDLQPIVLEYTSEEGPCVPIKLTAVAAQPGLGVAIFLLGKARGVPANYLHLEINEARLDWLNQGANYPDLVARAADEAGGHGFATDYSGSVEVVRPQLTQALNGYFRLPTETEDPVAFVQAVESAGLLGTSQNVLGILQRCVPQPAGVSAMPADFYANITAYRAELEDVVVEQPRCADDLRDLVIEPLRQVEALMQRQPVLTRLYTTLDPDEMTVDPIFTFNPDLEEVPLQRTVSARQICDGSTPTHIELTTSDGDRFVVPWSQTLQEGPALKVAAQMGPSGPPLVAIDNREEIAGHSDGAGCGCSLAVGPSLIGLGLLAMGLRGRRRRQGAG